MESQAPKRSEALQRFQELLRELFEFECADLDFGIYRIMNYKRGIMKEFIENKLPNIITEELSQGALAEQTRARQELQRTAAAVRESLGEYAINPDGSLLEQYRHTPIGKQYLEALQKAMPARSDEDLETAIYNHLYTFFRRYWQDGDFISKRRYSRREHYAIPYNGEEVYLYWANHDQYYIKTAEHFTDYSYKAHNGVTVHFKLRRADVEQNNVKGEKRFFLPQLDAIERDAQTRTLTIPFEYRPLTQEEQKRYGEKNQQETIIAEAVKEIPKRVQAACDQEALAALITERRKTDEGKSVSYLEHHLRQYTRRNTSDFFIHKDLKGFLSRELDFYLKNEVLNLDEMERAGKGLAEGWFQLLRIIKRIGQEIIEFLTQIENFQKMLWEKKKFVTETFYCITVGNIPEKFYPEIAQCEAQWKEWNDLGIPTSGSAGALSAPTLSGSAGVPPASSEQSTLFAPSSGSAGVPPAPITSGSAGVPPASSEQSTLFTPSGSAGALSAPTLSGSASVPPAPTTSGSAGVPPATSHKGYYSRGYLPHYDATNIYQFITLRLHDLVPAEVIEQWKRELHWREGLAADSKEAVELRRRIEEYADSGHGACYLRDERIAQLVQNALLHFDGERYRLIAWCIMPNHVHVLLQMMGEPLAKIVQSWKSFTAHEANKLLGRTGRFWMPDYFDRFIRDEAHFNATVEYILHNPVKAGLVDAPEKWRWSGFIPTNTQVGETTGGRDARVPSDGGITGGQDARVATELDAHASRSHEPQQLSEQDIKTRVAFLKEHPTLVIDTRHFPQDFTDRLLACFENLDDAIDGLLIHSENWQALNLLQERYKGRVKCVYIDPPYNARSSEIVYKNDYKHSSWLALMENRLYISRKLLTLAPVCVIAIDETEQEKLGFLLEQIFPEFSKTCITIVHNATGQQGNNFSYTHEFAYFIYPQEGCWIGLQDRSDRPDVRPLRNVSKGAHLRTDAANCFYPIYVKDGKIIGFGEVCDEDFHPSGANVVRPDGIIEVYPIDSHGVERKWVFARQTVEKIRDELEARYDSSTGLWDIIRTKKKFNYKTVWTDSRYSANSYGSRVLNEILQSDQFSFPKSIYTVRDCIDAALGNAMQGYIIDYFAGSGTTGHAVINLNREDGGRRKFILVEMADYFDTVLLPRLKKVIFTPEWKEGKPKRMATDEEAKRSPRILKVIRLESYEDALNNLTFDDESGQKMLEHFEHFEDEYLLRYMLIWETRRSETLLNVEKLAAPFCYKLKIHRDGETHERTVDLPETFNYLLGLQVQKRSVHDDNGRRYLIYRGALPNGRTAVVIWRDIQGWTDKDFQHEATIVADQKWTQGADEVYVNGDSSIPNAQSLDDIFKRRLFAPVEA